MLQHCRRMSGPKAWQGREWKASILRLEELLRAEVARPGAAASAGVSSGAPARRLCNRKVARPSKACVPGLARRVLRGVYEGAAWRLMGGAGALRPGVRALSAVLRWPERWPEKVALVPRLPEWLAAGDLGPPGLDMVPGRGSVLLAVCRPKVERCLKQESERLQRTVSLADVVNEQGDRLGIVSEDSAPGRKDKIRLCLRVWTRWPRAKQGLRVEVQHVLNERWGRNHVGKVNLGKE